MPFPSASAVQTRMPFPSPAPAYPWEQVANPTPAPVPTPPATPMPVLQPGMLQSRENFSPIPLPAERQNTRHKIPAVSSPAVATGFLGFVIAGLCVIAGGLLLVFVYFMGLSLPQTNSLSVTGITPAATHTVILSPTTAKATPTTMSSPAQGAFPGMQYISDPQMASSVNTATAQPLRASTTFAINQKVYVTFTVHPNGSSGAVCLVWYLNNHVNAQYAFAVTPDVGAGYSYTIYGSAGSAYVQISWASTTACSGSLLAQQVSFTVTH